MQRASRKVHGFSLVELVVVITVLAIITAGTATYITNSVRAYDATARRAQLATLGRLAVERVARELRSAVPTSVRIQNDCVEFFPAKAGSAYFTLPTEVAANSFTASAFTVPSGGPYYVAVYPLDRTALYAQSNPGPLAGFSAASGSPTATVTLSSTHRFSRHAPQRRFFLMGEPVSFCISGNALYRYSGYGIDAAQNAPPASGGSLLAEHIQTNDHGTSVTPFTFNPGNLRRNAVVELDFRFMQDNEWVRLQHEVQIRNVL
jgi:MSHA biogenesis protein MshO